MDNYSLVKNIALLLIQQQVISQGNFSVGDVRRFVELAGQSPGVAPQDDDEIEMMVRELTAHYQTVIGTERELIGEDEGWSKWLPARRGQLDWKFWSRYRTYLAQQSYPEDVLARLDSSTDRVLGLMGDPKREGSWDRRGLVVGLVQSGKTSHYVGAINKAIDAGYKVIVVLTGFTESLRVQTQDRLEKGVLGYSLRTDPNDKKRNVAVPCGVELITPIRPRVDSVTTGKNDFKTDIAKNFAIQVGGNPIIFVIKKNASVLKNLLQWVTNFGTDTDPDGNTYVSGIPLMVIDDESDVGSIDTKKGAIDQLGMVNEDHDPTKINKQIRKLLSLFDQSSYVGYTATPFANVLIHDQKTAGVDDEDGLLIGEDLFPRSFIVSLPTPSNHVGPTTVFGSANPDDQDNAGLPIIREVTDTQLGKDKTEQWMPESHKTSHIPVYHGQERIPPSLREAILSFILAVSARNLRGDANKHNSMLIHVTRFTDVQHRVFEQVEMALQDVLQRIRDNSDGGKILKELRNIWESGEGSFTETTKEIAKRPATTFQNPVHTWQDINSQILEAAGSIEVRKINGPSGDLEYDSYKDGLTVIAIGGDKLARGLTLEGLSVSYFLRCSRMYDTLMQMGRWFGYRPRYLDLCRLYTTEDLSDWFAHIADATEELRDEFDLMANSGCTPKEFGLKVRSHPTMMVTSAVKMRDGKSLQISFQGTLAQTIDFRRSNEVINQNWDAAKRMIHSAEVDHGVVPAEPRPNAVLWADVPGKLVSEFLESYSGHSAARTVKAAVIKKYIDSQIENGGLRKWTILLSGGRSATQNAQLGSGARVRRLDRDWYIQGTSKKELIESDHYRIKVLISPSDERIDLNQSEISEALRIDIADWEASDEIRKGKKVRRPDSPNGRFVRQVRSSENGLLILYPLSNDDGKADDTDNPTLGFAVSFPTVTALGDTPITYIVGNIYQQLEMDIDG